MNPSGLLLLDKPGGITSTRALAMARRALGASKAGHTGTLDPFATGLLPLVFGEATKFSRFLIDSTKGYRATLSLGEESPTGDPEGEVVRITDDLPDERKIAEVVRLFVGDINQIPPMHSAVHVGGRRLYEYAREGLEVPRVSREVHVSQLEITAIRGRQVDLAVTCSKGTYVRVLAMDIGKALGCGAYLTALRRVSVGPLRIEGAATLEALAAEGPAKAGEHLLPVETLVASLPRVDLASDWALRFGQGQVVPTPAGPETPAVAVFGPRDGFIGVGTREGERLVPLRLVAEPKFPDFA